jgi:hypothetical protein
LVLSKRIRVNEKANGPSLNGEGIRAWLEWEMKAELWRLPVEISRDGFETLVNTLGVVLEWDTHRRLHEGRRCGTIDVADG